METNSDSLEFPHWFSKSEATHDVARGIMQYGPIARTPLAQIFNLSQGALSRITSDLIYDGVIEEMPATVVRRILAQAAPEMRTSINEILRYPENSAGSIMTTEYVSLSPTLTVAEAITRIRRTGIDKETIYTCYVIRNRVLVGVVTVKDLLLAPDDDAMIESMMSSNVIAVNTHDDQEEVAQMFSKYDFMALPVVDAENRLVGIITFDDAMDVMEEEATEDIEKMAAIIPSEKPYMSMTPFEIWKNRIPWLMLLMVSATFTGLIISRFESALEKLVILTAFIPMLMDTAGNSGSQASVTVIRGLSLNEIEFSDILLIIWKEVRVAVLCGLSLGIACFGKILLVDYLIMDSFAGVSSPFLIIGVICITLSVTVLFAKIVGCTLPLFAKKLGFDPAVMASPFITTIVDALSLLVYFGVASAFLPI